MSATALKLVEPSPAAPQGRQNLVRAWRTARKHRAQYIEASASVTRLRGLIDAETLASAALR